MKPKSPHLIEILRVSALYQHSILFLSLATNELLWVDVLGNLGALIIYCAKNSQNMIYTSWYNTFLHTLQS